MDLLYFEKHTHARTREKEELSKREMGGLSKREINRVLTVQ
jgi:hypothetical protein